MASAMLQKALNIAFLAHKDQVDKGGAPYILHPIRVMLSFEDPMLQVIAVLHDVIEDSAITRDYLSREGFDENVLEALAALTKNDNEPYDDFIARAAKNKLARLVKMADIEDNLNVKRLEQLTVKDSERLNKYMRALQYLKNTAVD